MYQGARYLYSIFDGKLGLMPPLRKPVILLKYAGSRDSPNRARAADLDGPEMGAQFAQLVKELRSEYGGAVQACAFRISQVSPSKLITLPCHLSDAQHVQASAVR